MRDNRLRTTELLVILVAAIIAVGCGHGGTVVTTADSVLVKCTEVGDNTAPIVVAFDAKNRATIDKTLPKTHRAEVCKGRHSLVWFAENGKGLDVELLDKKGTDQSTGKLNGGVRCGDVVEKGTNDIIGSVCRVVTGTADGNGTLYYRVVVTPKGREDAEKVDPQVIIKDSP